MNYGTIVVLINYTTPTACKRHTVKQRGNRALHLRKAEVWSLGACRKDKLQNNIQNIFNVLIFCEFCE